MCAEFCVNDSDCPNNEKCCSNGCGHECTAPYTGMNIILYYKCLGQLSHFLSICVLFCNNKYYVILLCCYTGKEINLFFI